MKDRLQGCAENVSNVVTRSPQENSESTDNKQQGSGVLLENHRAFKSATRLFLLALTIRLLAIPLALTHINTYSEHDAAHFTWYAKAIANGALPLAKRNPFYVYDYWGTILSVWYVLPGPSDVYSHIFVSIIGAASVWFVYKLAVHLHSRRAAVYATLPMVVFPSFVLVQTTLIREGPVLLSLTAIAYLLIVPSDRSKEKTIGYTAAWFVFGSLFRTENVPVYLLVLGMGIGLHMLQQGRIEVPKDPSRNAVVGVLAGGVLGILASAQWVLSHVIGPKRADRSRGHSVYLQNIIPNDLITAAWFAPIGISYFLFAPFPWQVQSWVYLPPMLEGMANIALFGFAIYGVPTLLKRAPADVLPLLLGFVILTSLYGLMEGNVGASIRHRQSLIWVTYLCAGVSLAERYTFTIPNKF